VSLRLVRRQGVLARIDANDVCDCGGCLMGHSDVLLVLLSPRTFSERFGAGARPVHPILGHRAVTSVAGTSEYQLQFTRRF
jgi:hypothetical protein